jgi:hypothetical protein
VIPYDLAAFLDRCRYLVIPLLTWVIPATVIITQVSHLHGVTTSFLSVIPKLPPALCFPRLTVASTLIEQKIGLISKKIQM